MQDRFLANANETRSAVPRKHPEEEYPDYERALQLGGHRVAAQLKRYSSEAFTCVASRSFPPV